MPVTDEAIASLLSEILRLPAGEILSAPGRYAAFHEDDSFTECCEVDWDDMTVHGPDPSQTLVWGRHDIDPAHSLVDCSGVTVSTTTDTSLRELLASQKQSLFGLQIEELLAAGRLTPDQAAVQSMYGCLCWGGTLIEAARALFMLRDGDTLLDPSVSEYATVDPEWAERLGRWFDEATAAHLGLFFQEANANRCSGGAALDDDPDMDSSLATTVGGLPGVEILATWWLGEGQGAALLARLPGGWEPAVPAYAGRSLLRKPPVARDRLSLDFLEAPPAEVLRRTDDHHVHTLVRQLDQGTSLPALMEALHQRGQLMAVANIAGQLCGKRAPQPALVLLNAILPLVGPEHLSFVEVNRAVAFSQVQRFEEAREASRRAIAAHEAHPGPVPAWLLYKNDCWFSMETGDRAGAFAAIRRALEVGSDQPLVHGMHGILLLSEGDEAGARGALERCMSAGVDPHPPLAVSRHAVYRELALEHAIPVELAPGEDDGHATESGVNLVDIDA
ncbi:MAG: hypothetical protein KC621_29015 [Myxococcales bacterium]|nr:hypothetical protein [Myxococcales bacterium]